jgi:hypothetical protein
MRRLWKTGVIRGRFLPPKNGKCGKRGEFSSYKQMGGSHSSDTVVKQPKQVK